MNRVFVVIIWLAIAVVLEAGCVKREPSADVIQETLPTEEVTAEEQDSAGDTVDDREALEKADVDVMEEEETSEDGTYEIPEEEQIDKPMGSGGDQGPDYSGE